MIVLLTTYALALEPLQPDWPLPIDDRHHRGMLLVDQLELRVPGVPGTAGTDIEGWYGGDRDRMRYRAEGAFDLAEGLGDGELGLAYSRLVGPWIEFQLGLGAEAQKESGSGWESRLEVGLEAVAAYDFDVELFVRVSNRGRLSMRATAIKELRFSQRLILQGRAEATAAAQASAELDRPAGLEAISAGLRLRYEIRRELAPYLGVLWTGGMSPPSTTGFQSAGQAVGGIRIWW